MKKITLLTMSVLMLALVGCTTTAMTEFYRPAGSYETPYRIAGELDPIRDGATVVMITINEETVIEQELPSFWKTREAIGTFREQPVLVVFTKVRTFTSSYVRADVNIGNERAASLAF